MRIRNVKLCSVSFQSHHGALRSFNPAKDGNFTFCYRRRCLFITLKRTRCLLFNFFMFPIHTLSRGGIESVHCREEGCIGKYTPRGPRDFPRAGILHPEAREIAQGITQRSQWAEAIPRRGLLTQGTLPPLALALGGTI